MAQTKIEWADAVWNPVTGCTPVSEGCENCYARRMAYRLRGRCGYPEDEPFKVTLHPERLNEPMYWKKPRRIFVCSMGDLFHEMVPDDFIFDVFLKMTLCTNNHIFIILTKRPERMKNIIENFMGKKYGMSGKTIRELKLYPQKRIWLGVSVENQQRAEERIPILLQIPAAVRFVSSEPLLGAVDLSRWLGVCTVCGASATQCDPVLWQEGQKCCPDCTHGGTYLDWVIVGGETGPNARPMHPDWVRSLREQCQTSGVPFFFKGWGEFVEDINCNNAVLHPWRKFYAIHDGLYTGNFTRVGKKKAGRLIDGRTWDEFPSK